VEAALCEWLAPGPHLRVVELHDRQAHRAAVVALQPPLALPEIAMDEVRARARRLDRAAGLPGRIDAPVDLHGALELAPLQQPEILGHGATPVLIVAGAH